MKPPTISIFLLSFSLHIVAALKCYHCHEKNKDTCQHELKNCSEGDKCITISEEYKLNKSYHSIFKGCSVNMPCDETPYGWVNNDLHIKVCTKCCKTDGCNDGFYEMPEDDEPNGCICPACLEMDTVEECKPTSEIMCRAKDDKCLTFAGTVNKPAQSIQCKRCWTNDYTQCCNEKEIDCPGSKCMTVSEYGLCNGVEYNTIQKTCAIEELCGVCYSASNIHGFQLRVSSECGDGELSNADLNFKKICENPLPLNKYKCPSCFLTNTTKGCKADGEMICGGTETECFKYGGTLQLSNGRTVGMSVQGCITELGCKYEYKAVPGVREIDRDHFICAKAKTA